jgi:hypothetical protein
MSVIRGNWTTTRVVMHLLNMLDMAMGCVIVAFGFIVAVNWSHDPGEFITYCLPFFPTGGLMIFMALTSWCGISCPREVNKTCPNCCSILSDFLAFIVLAAEMALAVIILVAEDVVKESLMKFVLNCDKEHPNDLDGCPDDGSASKYVEKFESVDTGIAICLFVLSFLQVLRMVFNLMYRKNRLVRGDAPPPPS